ncbi:efflux RND transporter periplasmic adaptor subunit [Balneolaceae bacterium YR4-1]|uniref:Efflux RND transporter periplasmic adaptor subunit n=1 Tax=Halalkalibaculum roseum TaxID=2709311 RepID=A0A6M1T3A5_9BACT|nr:efflux RND transporter periplasmic adaptor subunit [Halalkalibaculum roseum]NGP77944.1 efflux RND transporter periplasmic adaptor subunit [Halalkalibaculum roseum]
MPKKIYSITNKTISLLAVAAVLLAFSACSNPEESQGEGGPAASYENIPAVEAVQARFGSLPLSERLSGTVIAKNQVQLYPEISGRISEVIVQNGEKVSKGAPLVRIEDNQYREQVQQAEAGLNISKAQLKQAQSRLNELQAQYKRTKVLSEKELSSDLEMERLEAQMESARADVELAEAQVQQAESTLQERRDLLSRTVIRAPISGTVGQRNAEIGMQVSTGTQLFIIGDLDELRIEVVLTENMLKNIEVGQTARIYASGTDETAGSSPTVLTAQLSRISPFLNNVTRSTEAEIDVKNQNNMLRPGMFVAVDILYGESTQATLIPTSALYTDPNTGNEGVYVATSLGSEVEVIEDSSNSEEPSALTQPIDVQFKPVNVIAEGRMELGVSGVESGSWIVTVGQNLLSQGRSQARIRTSSWDRILTLQGLQRQDLLRDVLNEQKSRQQTM